MGNQMSRGRHEMKLSSKLSNLLKSIRSRTRSNSTSGGNSIIQRFRGLSLYDHGIQSELDIRRLVFVSVIGLYNTWKAVPFYMLYSSLLILPLKKEWIYASSTYSDELNLRLNTLSFHDTAEAKEFILLLKWKDSQGLVCWMADDIKSGPGHSLVASSWHNVSEKLKGLYDPVKGTNYKPLKFVAKWWQNKETFVSKYNAKSSSIMSELYFVTMKFNTMQEVLYQSNPDSLIPIKSFGNVTVSRMTSQSTSLCGTMDDSAFSTNISNSDGHETWFISPDYDPYDME